ncbi:MAG: hypothetical protein ACPGYW_00035 [Alphaproteobacteria bacterium]
MMLKKKFLLSLIIFQGVLIVIAIIAIIIGVFYKYDNDKNLKDISLTDLHIDDISLLDEEHYQYKIIEENKIIFQIIDIENNKIKREIIIEK